MSDVRPVGASATPGSEITIAPVADEIRTQLWSRLPYRHFELEITVFNGTDSNTGEMVFEVGFPQDVIFDLKGAAWNPSHRHQLDGTIYDVWSTWPGFGRDHADSGVWITPNGHWRERLTVNLKPSLTHAVVLRRLFEGGDPITDWIEEDVTFKPFEPHI